MLKHPSVYVHWDSLPTHLLNTHEIKRHSISHHVIQSDKTRGLSVVAIQIMAYFIVSNEIKMARHPDGM